VKSDKKHAHASSTTLNSHGPQQMKQYKNVIDSLFEQSAKA